MKDKTLAIIQGILFILAFVIGWYFISNLGDDLMESNLQGACELSKLSFMSSILEDVNRLQEHRQLCQTNCSWFDDRIEDKIEQFTDMDNLYDCDEMVEELLE